MNKENKDLDYYTKAIIAQYPTVQLHRVTKISKNNGMDIPPDYWVIGELQLDCYKVCGKIYIWRLANSTHPEGRLGEFTSSEIMTIEYHGDYDLVHTFNSVYRVEKINSVMSVIQNVAKLLGKNLDDK